jgi:class 3 adenylate cyclase
MADSTKLVDSYVAPKAAEMYKAFLHCAARLIKAAGGTITAYDGDRIMAVFIGDYKNTTAVLTALKINHAVNYIINPLIDTRYPNSGYTLRHCVGIDTSQLLAARIGVRNDNDIVWVGRAANYAAKLSGLNERPYATFITDPVYRRMANEATYWFGTHMWEPRVWAAMNNLPVHRSSWWVHVDY